MTTLIESHVYQETAPEITDAYDAYSIDLERIQSLTTQLVEQVEPYLFEGKKFENGDVITGIGDKNFVYVLDGNNPLSDIGRSIEAEVYETDSRWQQERELTQRYHEGLEDGSRFLLFVDASGDTPKAVGSIRVNTVSDPKDSGTLKYYNQAFPDGTDYDDIVAQLPSINVHDIVDLAILSDYRGLEKGIAPWLYQTLERYYGMTSDIWIACINDHAAKQLGLLGIKLATATDKKATYDGDQEEYGYYADTPANIREKTVRYYEALLARRKQTELSRALASAAMISAHGRVLANQEITLVA